MIVGRAARGLAASACSSHRASGGVYHDRSAIAAACPTQSGQGGLLRAPPMPHRQPVSEVPAAFQLFTDGACLGNPGPGGWAFLLRDCRSLQSPTEVRGFGGMASTTNNRMELTAVIEGLLAIPATDADQRPIDLCSDSEYVLRGISEWMPKWKAKGWRLAGGNKPVKNVELWQELDSLLRVRPVRTTWVRGHDGHPENELCDQLASEEAARWARGEGTPSAPRASVEAEGPLWRSSPDA